MQSDQTNTTKRKREDIDKTPLPSTQLLSEQNSLNIPDESEGKELMSSSEEQLIGSEEDDRDDDLMEPYCKKIKTEYELKATLVNEENFPSQGSKLYVDEESSIEDIWHVKNVRKIIMNVLDADLDNWYESEEKSLFDKLVERREEIESISLFFAESMVKKVAIHDTKFITEMIENMSKLVDDYASTLHGELVEDFTPAHGTNTVKHWTKYILPEIVKKQNELNLIELNHEECVELSPEEEKERTELFNLMQYDAEEEIKYAFLLDSCNLASPNQIKEKIDEEEESCEEMEETPDDNIIDHFYNEYLFDRVLPDEKDKVGISVHPYKGVLKEDAALLQEDNPFLTILEKTIRMFVEETKEEHQDLQVSHMRLGLSLLMLDCLNRELTYAFNRYSVFHAICRPLVRAILDHFMDFDTQNIYFKRPPSIAETDGMIFIDMDVSNDDSYSKVLRELKNTFDTEKPSFEIEDFEVDEIDYSDEESELSEDNIDESDDEYEMTDEFLEHGEDLRNDYMKVKYENYRYAPCGGDTNVRYFQSEHPLWNGIFINQENLKMLKQHQLNSYNPVPLTTDSTNNWLFTEEKVANTNEEVQVIPLHEQKIVTLFPNRFTEQDVIANAEHLFVLNGDVIHQPPTHNSIHIDINRIFRRAANLSCSAGAIVEGFLSLKSFISRIIETLLITKKDDLVTKLDIMDALDVCNQTIYPGLQLNQIAETNYVPFEPSTFTTEPVYSPACPEDIVMEKIGTFFSDIPTDNPTEVIPYHDEYDTVINNSTFADDITQFLKDTSPYNDSFIELNGHKIEVYTPIIKNRCRTMYDEHFSTPEKRSQGFSLSVENSFTFDMAYYWVESYYLGIYESMTGNNEQDNDFDSLFRTYRIQVYGASKSYSSDDPEELSEHEEYTLDYLDPSNKCLTLNSLYKDEETKDFDLFFLDHATMERKSRRVHKYILACRSLFFRKILEGNYTDRVSDSFDVSDMFKDEQSIDAFLHYLYNNFVVLPTLNVQEFYARELWLLGLDEILTDAPTKKIDHVENENEKEINLYLSLFISSDYLIVEGLKNLCEHVLGSLVDKDNAIQFLEFSNEHSSETIASFVDHFLLSTSLVLETPSIINNDISLYYEILSGPTTIENVAEKLGRTLELADKSDSQLYTYLDERIESFHIPQMIDFILSNYDHFSQQESFQKSFKELKYSESLSVWDYVSKKYNAMNSLF